MEGSDDWSKQGRHHLPSGQTRHCLPMSRRDEEGLLRGPPAPFQVPSCFNHRRPLHCSTSPAPPRRKTSTAPLLTTRTCSFNLRPSPPAPSRRTRTRPACPSRTLTKCSQTLSRRPHRQWRTSRTRRRCSRSPMALSPTRHAPRPPPRRMSSATWPPRARHQRLKQPTART